VALNDLEVGFATVYTGTSIMSALLSFAETRNNLFRLQVLHIICPAEPLGLTGFSGAVLPGKTTAENLNISLS
jgi:hypothetical protein